jgi:hypothetical protein
MGALVPYPDAKVSTINRSGTGYSEEDSSVRAIAIVLGLLLRAISLLLMLGLLIISSLAWFWLASFRSGWRLADWLKKQPENQDKLSLNILYGAVVAVLSPLAIIGDWSQKLVSKISEKFQIECPPKIDLKQIIETQLGIKLPNDPPNLPKQSSTSEAATVASGSK